MEYITSSKGDFDINQSLVNKYKGIKKQWLIMVSTHQLFIIVDNKNT